MPDQYADRFRDLPVDALFRWIWPDGRKRSVIYRKTADDRDEMFAPREASGWRVERVTPAEAEAEGMAITAALATEPEED